MKTHDFVLVGADTDSTLINKRDHSPFSEQERIDLLADLNSIFPERIRFEDDGYFLCVVVLKAKNYILYDGKKIKKKGSSLKSSKIEPALKDFMDDIIAALVFKQGDHKELVDIYNKHILLAHNVSDIKRWAGKKTVTDAVLNGKGTTEAKIRKALEGKKLQMGDKYYFYFAEETRIERIEKVNKKGVTTVREKVVTEYPLKLVEHWTGDHSTEVLVEKLYKTLKIFANVIDMSLFPDYSLKNNKPLLEKLVNENR